MGPEEKEKPLSQNPCTRKLYPHAVLAGDVSGEYLQDLRVVPIASALFLFIQAAVCGLYFFFS